MLEKRLKEIKDELSQIETRSVEIRKESETADSLEKMEELRAELADAETRKAELEAEAASIQNKIEEARAIENGEADNTPMPRSSKKSMKSTSLSSHRQ